MITYKNITDVEVLNEMPEGATALVIDDGELKQVGLDKFNKKEIAERVVVFRYDDNYDNPTCNLTFEEFDVLQTQQKIVGFTIIEDKGTSSKIYSHAPAEVFMSDGYYAFNVDYGGMRFELHPDNHVEMTISPK